MSFLVEMDRDRYPADALGSFDGSKFDPGSRTAIFGAGRAMMWLSQLAYETANPEKISGAGGILPAWGLAQRLLIDNPPDNALPLKTACAVVAGGRGATLVAFAGTDPLKINDWITDFDAFPSTTGIHTGFAKAVDRIWSRLRAAIASPPAAERAVFFTGHSLGGALAIVAAERAMRELGVQATAIFTFGSPRPGDARFATAFPPALGNSTFRFVHGTDLVATVGPSFVGFRHVGNFIHCASGGRFDAATPVLPHGNDMPEFFESGLKSVVVVLGRAFDGQLLSPVGQGALGAFFGVLPQQIRDHIPPSYFAALAA